MEGYFVLIGTVFLALSQEKFEGRMTDFSMRQGWMRDAWSLGGEKNIKVTFLNVTVLSETQACLLVKREAHS